MPLTQGIEAGNKLPGAGGVEGIFTAIFKGYTEEKRKRQEEDKRRAQEEEKLERTLREIVAQSKANQETERVKAGEERKTKREFPTQQFKITGTDVKEYEKATPIPWWERLWPGAQSAPGKERVQFRQQFKNQFIPGGGVSPSAPGTSPAPAASPPVGIASPASSGQRIRVRLKASGQTGTIEASEFDPNIYERL